MSAYDNLIGVPKNVAVIELLFEKILTTGPIAQIYLVKTDRQYEAAFFLNGHYKHGPPIPRLLENPTENLMYWMGVRPKIGLSQAEGDDITMAVNVRNKVAHLHFFDKWGKDDY
jgi:hypothetical protein